MKGFVHHTFYVKSVTSKIEIEQILEMSEKNCPRYLAKFHISIFNLVVTDLVWQSCSDSYYDYMIINDHTQLIYRFYRIFYAR